MPAITLPMSATKSMRDPRPPSVLSLRIALIPSTIDRLLAAKRSRNRRIVFPPQLTNIIDATHGHWFTVVFTEISAMAPGPRRPETMQALGTQVVAVRAPQP